MGPRALGIFVLAFVALPVVAHAQANSIALVVSQGRGAPKLNGPVKKHVEPGLKSEVTVVDQKAYLAAGKKAGLKKAKALLPENAGKVGQQAEVTHVVFIASLMERDESKKKVFYADVSIIEVSSGESVHANKYALEGRKLTAEVGVEIIAAVISTITAPPEVPEPPAETTSDDLAAAEGDTASGAADGTLADAEGVADTSSAGTSESPAAPEGESDAMAAGGATASSELEPATDTGANPEWAQSPQPEPASVVMEPTYGTKPLRPALHLHIGPMFLNRHARIMTRGEGPILYEWPMTGGYGKLEFYPLALGGSGKWYEGLGLHLEGELLYAKTEKWGWSTNDPTREVESGVGGVSGGLSYRFLFWNAVTAPDFTVKAGYTGFVFPLKEGAFPGTRYQAPYFGGTLTIPVVEAFGVMVGGNFSPIVGAAGRLKRLGEPDSANAFEADLGVRLFLEPFEILVVGRFEQFRSTFTGTTNLDDSDFQYRNVSLTDRMYGGFATLGYTL